MSKSSWAGWYSTGAWIDNGLSSGETGINCETSGTDWEAQGAKRDLSSAPEAK